LSKINFFTALFLLCSVFIFAGCSGATRHFAPVANGWTSPQASQAYRVQRSDTLYSIAFRYELDADKLAKANNISPPYHLVVGQTLNLLPEANDSMHVISVAPVSTPVVVGAAPAVTPITSQPVAEPEKVKSENIDTANNLNGSGPVGEWNWPANGKIIQGYSNVYAGNKGVDISGKLGDPVKATAAGRVVYCGTGLRGYGRLIIIKHNAKYLSAYAHNSETLVKEGDKVSASQVIAKMGSSDAPRVMLHFEIRKSGSPVDPLKLLPPRKG
jgi:lipoprotein NlpD